MNANHEKYDFLLRQFLEHQISPQEFQTAFFDYFQNESIGMAEPLFLLLDELFGALDCYTEDIELLAERPGFYLDLKGLKQEAADISQRLKVATR